MPILPQVADSLSKVKKLKKPAMNMAAIVAAIPAALLKMHLFNRRFDRTMEKKRNAML